MSEQVTRAQSTSLTDLLDRILDKGVVIAGDIRIDLVGVELLTIKIRLLIASVDKAKEMGINWWENDPFLTTRKAEAVLGPAPQTHPIPPLPKNTTP